MKISENRLRKLIRHFLHEQVVGYTPPQEKGTSNGYVDTGDISEPLSDASAEDQEEMGGTQVQSLTQQRQAALDKGDSVTARSLGQELALLRKQRG